MLLPPPPSPCTLSSFFTLRLDVSRFAFTISRFTLNFIASSQRSLERASGMLRWINREEMTEGSRMGTREVLWDFATWNLQSFKIYRKDV